MWERMKPVVDDYIVVTLDETKKAMRLMAEKARIISEGAARVARCRCIDWKKWAKARSLPLSRAAIST